MTNLWQTGLGFALIITEDGVGFFVVFFFFCGVRNATSWVIHFSCMLLIWSCGWITLAWLFSFPSVENQPVSVSSCLPS